MTFCLDNYDIACVRYLRKITSDFHLKPINIILCLMVFHQVMQIASCDQKH
jgi:hypothetical protein